LAGDDALAEEILKALKKGALEGRALISGTQSGSLSRVPESSRPDAIVKLVQAAQTSMAQVGGFVEKLAPKDVSTLSHLESDLGDFVEREMRNAAKAIEDAARRLESLMSKPREGANLQVHSAILEAAMAITTAIGNLIRCATAAEQEIVAQGRGAASKGAFYKKNNKWTEGLISAAKSVAVATTYLVEVADGLIHGTHTWEQLVVAAQEVSVATTQLVAASRVKAVPFSKTQDKLESAAVAVREATSLLVKAAKEASKQSAEQKAQEDLRKMGRHEFKVKEMEQQVKILEIEKELQTARYKLAEIRKSGYSE
jgi:hypothetical protein